MSRALPLVLAAAALVLVVAAAWASPSLLSPSAAVPDPVVLATLQVALPNAITGEVLTVATVTGTAERAAALEAAHRMAVAEAMEGSGVACAALVSR